MSICTSIAVDDYCSAFVDEAVSHFDCVVSDDTSFET